MRGLCLLSCALWLAAPAWAAKDAAPDWVKAAMAQPLPALPKSAPAVVLLDECTITVAADGKAVEHRRHVVKILRATGRDEGLIDLSFDDDSKLLALHVWSVAPDGHEFALKDGDLREVGYPGSGNFYDDMRRKVASPPGRDVGGVVAYEYDQRVPPYTREATWFFQSDLPHLAESFTLELPPGYTYRSVWAHHQEEKAIDLEHQRTRWTLNEVPAIDLDRISMAPDPRALAGRMTVHYAPAGQVEGLGTWGGVGAFYNGLVQPRAVATPEIAGKAAALTSGKTDFYDRTEALGEFVQKDVRYFVVEKGIGGRQPHPAADIFRNRYGDCKDKATLLVTMLESVGIHATLVLVDSHRGMIDPAAPSELGNHAIAAVEIPAGYQSAKLRSVVTTSTGKRYLIVDPTSEKTAYGQLEHTLQGGYALLVAPAGSEVVRLPVLGPECNTVRRSGKLTLAADGSLKGAIVERSFGDLSEFQRYLYAYGDEKERQTYLEHRLGHDFSSFTATDARAEDTSALNKDVVTHFDLAAAHYSRAMGPLLMVRPRVLGTVSMTLRHEPRTLPINLEQSMLHQDDFTIELPEGYAVDELPEPVKVDMGFAAYESASRLEGNALHYTRTYTVREVTLPAERFDDLEHLVAIIDRDEQNNVVLKKK